MESQVRVIPARGDLRDTARLLLDLADDPQDVRTVNGGAEFEVPEYLADKFNAKRTPKKRASKKEDDA